MADDPWMSDDQAERVLQRVLAGADAWQDRAESDVAWNPQAGSALAGDDLCLDWMQASHLAQGGLNVAADNLQAVMALTVQHRTLHAYAPATQIRAALESAAMVIWLLAPEHRQDRLVRALRWTFTDAKDERRALGDMPASAVRFERKVAAIREVAGRAGLEEREVLKQIQSTEAVQGADDYLASRGETGVLLLWRLTSGYSHGRRWAWLSFSHRELSDDANLDTVGVKMVFTNDRLAIIALPTFGALESATALYDTRATTP